MIAINFLLLVCLTLKSSLAFQAAHNIKNAIKRSTALAQSSTTASPSWFSSADNKQDEEDTTVPLEKLKAQILQLGAALDRGQSYNPTSGSYYQDTMAQAKATIKKMVDQYPKPAMTLQEMEGEWELVLSTVAHGIFRSSPFFLAIQESYEKYAEEKGKELSSIMSYGK